MKYRIILALMTLGLMPFSLVGALTVIPVSTFDVIGSWDKPALAEVSFFKSPPETKLLVWVNETKQNRYTLDNDLLVEEVIHRVDGIWLWSGTSKYAVTSMPIGKLSINDQKGAKMKSLECIFGQIATHVQSYNLNAEELELSCPMT